jgi:sugar lactone lactonase YvrE
MKFVSHSHRFLLCALLLGVFCFLSLPVKAQRMPQDSWYLAKEFSAGGVGKFSYPQDVAVGPDGNLYVADTNNYQIQVLDADGLFLRSWNGNSAEVPNNSSFNPRAVAVSSDGKVYVADTNYYNISRILVFDAQGKFLRSMGQQGSAAGQLNNPTSIAVDASGNVYVGDNNYRITVFDADGAYVRHWGGYGNSDDKFNYINDIHIVSGNKLAVLANACIRVFNSDGTLESKTNGIDASKMSVDVAGNYYLRSWGDTVQKYSSSGTLLQEFNLQGKIGNDAYGLAVKGDKIYLTDYSNHRINIIDTSGNFIAARGTRGSSNDASVYGLATDALGNIYLADFDMGEIRKYDANHQLLKKFGTQGSGDGQFSGVRELAIGANQKLYALDQNNNRVQIFGLEGNFLGKFGSSGSGNGQFSVPYGLAVGKDNKVYVADKDNHRVQIFDANGNFLSKFGKEGSFDGEFKSPMGLSISPDQKLAVADSGNSRIQIFDTGGTYLTKYAPKTNQWGYYDDYFSAERLSYASDGLLFATEFGGNRIRVYSPEGANIKEWYCKSCAMAETKSGDLIAAHGDRVVRLWKRTFRTVHPEPSNAIPLPAILSQGRRPGSSLVDVEYRVKDADDATVQTAALAFKNGGNSLSDVIPITSLAEGTGNKLGSNISTGQTHRFTWNVAGDWNTDFAEVQLEVLAKDNRGLLNLDFLRIPAGGGNPELKISRSPVNDNDFLSVWYWLLATGDPDVRLDNGQVLALNGSTQLEGLVGEYYSEVGFKGNATLRFGEVPNISYYGYGQNQAKSVRWTGQFVPQQTGNYTIRFYQGMGMGSKPNVKFSVNGNEVTMNPDLIDPYNYMPSSYSSSFNFLAQSGIPVPIKIEYDVVPSYPNFSTNIQKPDSDSTSPSLSDFKNTSTILAMGSTTTKLGRDFIFQRMGLREATAAEVTRAKEAGTPRVINQWEPEFKVGPDERPAKVNAYGFDTGAEGYWAVPVAGN